MGSFSLSSLERSGSAVQSLSRAYGRIPSYTDRGVLLEKTFEGGVGSPVRWTRETNFRTSFARNGHFELQFSCTLSSIAGDFSDSFGIRLKDGRCVMWKEVEDRVHAEYDTLNDALYAILGVSRGLSFLVPKLLVGDHEALDLDERFALHRSRPLTIEGLSCAGLMMRDDDRIWREIYVDCVTGSLVGMATTEWTDPNLRDRALGMSEQKLELAGRDGLEGVPSGLDRAIRVVSRDLRILRD